MKQSRPSPLSGFTLIEIMIAVGISAIVLTALISVFSSQQRVYSQQSDLAKSQASARAALYMIARDLRMAGYTGIPLGIKLLSEASDAYPVLSIKDGNTWLNNPSWCRNTYIEGRAGTLTDAIEIWGNFQRNSTRLVVAHPATTITLQVADAGIFDDSGGLNTPGWIAIGSADKVELHAVRPNFASTDAEPDTVTLDDQLTINFDLGTEVVPIFRRVYWVDLSESDYPEPTLMVSNCRDKTDNSTCTHQVLATGVDDLQFLYSLADTGMNIVSDRHYVSNPCSLRSVEVTLQTTSRVFRRTTSSALHETALKRSFSTLVRIRNTFDMRTCLLSGNPPDY